MTRIIAGTARGKTLQVPKHGTRPTSERVRESLFSMLEHEGAVRGASVLDLYAGSGALALEALSRGATDAVLADISGPAVQAARRNVRRCGFDNQARVLKSDAIRFLEGTDQTFDLIFLDPPYDISPLTLTDVLDRVTTIVEASGTVVLERSRRGHAVTTFGGLEVTKERVWGDTAAWFLKVKGPAA